MLWNRVFWVIWLTIKCWGHKQSVLYHTESVLNHMFDIFTSFPCSRYSPKLLHVSSIRDCRIPQFVLQIVEPWVRDGWRYQNGWIFGKVPKGGGGGHFQSKNLYWRFWAFIQGFIAGFSEKNCNLIFRKWGEDQRPFGILPKIHPFWYRHPSLRHSWKCLHVLNTPNLNSGISHYKAFPGW